MTSAKSARVAGWTVKKAESFVAADANGDIAFSATTAAAGTKITITATPDTDYGLATVAVKQGETPVATTMVGNTATFTMPAGNVEATATFATAGSIENAITVKNDSSNITSVFASSTDGTPYDGFNLATFKTNFSAEATNGQVSIAYEKKSGDEYSTVASISGAGTYKLTLTITGASPAYKNPETGYPVVGYVSLAKATTTATVTRSGKVDKGTYTQAEFLGLFTTDVESDGAKTWSLKKGSGEYAALGTSETLDAGATYTLKLEVAESDDFAALATPVICEFEVKADIEATLARAAGDNPKAGNINATAFKSLFTLTTTHTGDQTWKYKKDGAASWTTLDDSTNALEVGDYKVMVSIAATADNNAVDTAEADLTVAKAPVATSVTITTLNATSAIITLDGVVAAGTLSMSESTDGEITLTGGTSVAAEATSATITFASGSLAINKTYIVTLTPTDATNYSAVTSNGKTSDTAAKIGGITLTSEEFAVDDKVLTSSTAGTFVDQYGNSVAATDAATAFANNTDTKTFTPATDNAGGGRGTLSITDDGKLKLEVTTSASENTESEAKTSTYSIVIGGSTVTFDVSVAASATVFSGTVAAGATPDPEP